MSFDVGEGVEDVQALDVMHKLEFNIHFSFKKVSRASEFGRESCVHSVNKTGIVTLEGRGELWGRDLQEFQQVKEKSGDGQHVICFRPERSRVEAVSNSAYFHEDLVIGGNNGSKGASQVFGSTVGSEKESLFGLEGGDEGVKIKNVAVFDEV